MGAAPKCVQYTPLYHQPKIPQAPKLESFQAKCLRERLRVEQLVFQVGEVRRREGGRKWRDILFLEIVRKLIVRGVRGGGSTGVGRGGGGIFTRGGGGIYTSTSHTHILLYMQEGGGSCTQSPIPFDHHFDHQFCHLFKQIELAFWPEGRG